MNLILGKQFLSIFIMYKTWANTKIREHVIKCIRMTGKCLGANIAVESNSIEVKKEMQLLESLCDHICIRDEIKTELRGVFQR